MATTVTSIVDEVIDELRGRRRSIRTKLNGAVTTGDTTIVVQSGDEVRVGDYLEIDDELVYVDSFNSADSVEVDRGEKSSTPASHSDGVVVHIQPEWARYLVLQKLQEEIDDLPWDIYGEDEVTVSLTTSDRYVEITPTNANWPVIDILEARRDPDNTKNPVNRVPVQLIRDTTEFSSSGVGLQLVGGWTYRGTQTLHVTLAVGRSTATFTSSTDLEDTVGLNANTIQAVKYGTIYRMLNSREIRRSMTNAMAEARRADEIQPMQLMQTAVQFRAEREMLLDHERARLMSKWGGRIALGV